VSQTAGVTTTDLYYSTNWQVLEERQGGAAKAQYVWSPGYVDALVLRDRDADGSSGNGLEERLYAAQNANYDVTALFDAAGAVRERLTYDPFGMTQVRDAAWNVKAQSDLLWLIRHQGLRLDLTSGLYEARYRWYNPSLGRWIRLDPLGYMAGDNSLYRFVDNNPLIYVDPTGEVTRPGLTYSSIYKDYGKWGAISWAIQWKVKQSDDCGCLKGGVILQKIRVFNASSKVGGKKSKLYVTPYGRNTKVELSRLDYWEAWRVTEKGNIVEEHDISLTTGSIFTTGSPFFRGSPPQQAVPKGVNVHDTFQMFGEVGSSGTYSIQAEAIFVQGMTDSDLKKLRFGKTGRTGAGGLDSLDVYNPDPSGVDVPRRDKERALNRFLDDENRVDCVSPVVLRFVDVKWDKSGGTTVSWNKD
jgi:RHS repeat-associated protein